jgi:small subunit ribosomal protein S16
MWYSSETSNEKQEDRFMAVKIRLARTGRKKMAFYRVVVADSKMPRDGRCIAYVGTYAPRENPAKIVIDEAVTLKWLAKGAQPTETVKSLLKKSGAWEKFLETKAGKPATA